VQTVGRERRSLSGWNEAVRVGRFAVELRVRLPMEYEQDHGRDLECDRLAVAPLHESEQTAVLADEQAGE
jgi:hypothetical protein